MLVLTRGLNQSIQIGPKIKVIVTRIDRDEVWFNILGESHRLKAKDSLTPTVSVVVTLLRIKGHLVSLGIVAPGLKILREELCS